MAMHLIVFLSSVLAIRYQMLVILWADGKDSVVRQMPACYYLSDVVEASIWCLNKLLGIKTRPSETIREQTPHHCRRDFPVSKHLR